MSLFFVVELCGVAIWANARFRTEARLPMQWWLDGQVTWSAPRRVAVAFIPAVSITTLAGLSALLAQTQPRPGEEGMVIPALLGFGSLCLGAQIFHLWLVGKTLSRSDR